jgi:GNAT superfamily N-acetyltransferase
VKALVTASVRVRKAVVADGAAIADVWTRSISELCALDHGGDPALIAAWCADKTPEALCGVLSQVDNVWLVAVDGANRVLGFGSLAQGGKVAACYVDPSVVRSGIGSSLLEALEDEALRRGYATVTLVSSRTAQPFYVSRGFVSAGPPETFRGMASYPMRKVLKRAGA